MNVWGRICLSVGMDGKIVGRKRENTLLIYRRRRCATNGRKMGRVGGPVQMDPCPRQLTTPP